MNPILQALQSGYSEEDLLKFLSKAVPKLTPMITKAMGAGYGIKQILGFLGKAGSKQDTTGMTPDQIRRMNKQNDAEMEKMGLTALVTGAGSMLMGGASKAAPLAAQSVQGAQTQTSPMATKALQHAAPQLIGPGALPHNPNASVNPLSGGPNNSTSAVASGPLQSSSAPTLQMPQSMHPQQNVSASQFPVSSQQSPVSPNIPQPPPITQAEVINTDLIKNSIDVKSKIDQLLKAGNGPEQIDAYLRQFDKKAVKDIEKKSKVPLRDMIGAYAQEAQQQTPQTQQTPEASAPIEVPGLESKVSTGLPAEEMAPESAEEETPAKIEKGATVATPHGVGEVLEQRNGKSLVEVDGKRYQVDDDELDAEPEDVIQEVQNILKIPEVDRSSVVSLFTYDPVDKQMFIQFHNGSTTKYLDVDPQKVFAIANKMGMPVTEGKNIFGAWSPEDKKSLGATLIKEIINDPKYKKTKKGEQPNPNYRNLETFYDYWQGLRKKPKRKRL